MQVAPAPAEVRARPRGEGKAELGMQEAAETSREGKR